MVSRPRHTGVQLFHEGILSWHDRQPAIRVGGNAVRQPESPTIPLEQGGDYCRIHGVLVDETLAGAGSKGYLVEPLSFRDPRL